MNSEVTEIKLPRPNPGPEPLTNTDSWTPVWVASGFVLALVVFFALAWRRRRRDKRDDRTENPVIDASEDRSLEEQVRNSLVDLFGEAWSAMTTEEMANSTALDDRFGPEIKSQLLDYLRGFDRQRFSGLTLTPDPASVSWATQFLEFVGTLASPTSMIKGR